MYFSTFFYLHFLDNFQDTGCNVLVLNFGNANLSVSTIINYFILLLFWSPRANFVSCFLVK